jgi:general secretion pathway protein A
MYLAHYGLGKKPFDISPNPEFLWLGEKHREGLAILKYGILENKGFLLITGDIGTGKTALIRAIEKDLQARAIVVTIPDPGLNLMDFYNFLAAELNMDRSFTNKGDFLIHFKRMILNAFASYRRVLLIIDESQRLSHELMEEIRLLSNIDLAGKVLINIFFVGQTEFREVIARPENRAVRQRITVSYHLAPLTEEEVRQYIAHRMNVAGASQEVFTPAAIQAVSRVTQGYPRLINIVCDHALMSGYSRGQSQVDADIIRECAEELKITIGRMPSQAAGAPPAAAAKTAAAPKPAPPDPTPAAAADSGPDVSPAEKPRSSRGALVAAICLLALGASWYFWGDAISDEIARWAKPRETRDVRGPAPEQSGNQIARVTPPAAEPAPRETKPAPPSPAPEAKPPAIPAVPAEPPKPAPEPRTAAPAPAKPEPEPAAPAPPSAATPPTRPAPPSPPESAGAAAAESFTLKGFTVFFAQNSIEIPLYANEMLTSAAALMKSNPGTAAIIEGHTDSVGDAAYNRLISENRAAVVRNFLVGQGVALSRLSVAGYGAERPIESNSTPEGRSKNRRVMIRLVPAKQG